MCGERLRIAFGALVVSVGSSPSSVKCVMSFLMASDEVAAIMNVAFAWSLALALFLPFVGYPLSARSSATLALVEGESWSYATAATIMRPSSSHAAAGATVAVRIRAADKPSFLMAPFRS